MKHILVEQQLRIKSLRLTQRTKRSTLNGEVAASAATSSLQGARSFGINTGSIPVRSSRFNVNLQNTFSKSEIREAYKVLSARRFKKNFSELKRFSGRVEREENSLGSFLNTVNLDDYYSDLRHFSFSPYTGMKIKKSNGKYRPLLIPHPKDRIVLTASFLKIKNILKDELLKQKALGLGLNKKKEITECKIILTELQKSISTESYSYVLKLDFKDFFSTIDRKKLLQELTRYFKGKEQRRLFRIVKSSINNQIDADADFHGRFGHLKLKTKGIPQGLSYSPLLASFYALPLDKVSKNTKGCKSYRYLDDMIVLAQTETQVKNAYKFLKKQSEKLNLNLHPLKKSGSKTKLINAKQKSFEFLGIKISRNGLFIPESAVSNFKNTFQNEIVNAGIVKKYSFEQVLNAYKSYATGWINHYKTLCPEHFREVERQLLLFMEQYIEKHKTRKTVKTFFGNQRLTLSKPFLKIKGS